MSERQSAPASAPGAEPVALLPCPFCGGEVHLVEGEECAYVQCLDVKFHRALWLDGDNNAANDVREAWNRRASPAAAQAPDAASVERCIEALTQRAKELRGDGDLIEADGFFEAARLLRALQPNKGAE
jgi:hypothetical protein